MGGGGKGSDRAAALAEAPQSEWGLADLATQQRGGGAGVGGLEMKRDVVALARPAVVAQDRDPARRKDVGEVAVQVKVAPPAVRAVQDDQSAADGPVGQGERRGEIGALGVDH
ncbi:hypothetical protein Pen01_33140 [Phytomonospora endophytica]|nr:hypothetical protein Pen01_33140 [Phytomonospora endophytica]